MIVTVLAIAAPGRAAEDSPKARLAAIEAAQEEASARYGRELQAAGPAAEAQKSADDRYLAEIRKNVAAALRLAREAPNDPASAEALKFVIRTNRAGSDRAAALSLMLDRRQFLDKDQGNVLGYIALTLFQNPEAERYLRRVLDENPRREDRGAACYWLSRHYRRQAQVARGSRARPERHEVDPEMLERRYESLLERTVKEFGDVILEGDARPIRDFVVGELFAMQNLNVGQPAPEIEGTDSEGRAFKLSETWGKVVVLTFSGNWCGPCVGMYPQERNLVSRHKGHPFALVSVNTDKELATLKASIARGDITWRCWWDGSTDGPITTRWGIQGFPSIFVLDKTGMIRFKDVKGDDLDKAIAALLKEVSSKR
jgi:thiol-disulfide isomerase/thioredoxin